MFKLKEKYKINKNIFKRDYIRYSPSEISTINTANSPIYIKIPGEDSVISLLTSYHFSIFDVLHAATSNRYVDGNDKKLVRLGPFALFTSHKLPCSSGELLEEISQAHIVDLMYKLISTAKSTDDLFIGFDRERGRRQRELINNKIQKGNYQLRFVFKDVLGFSEHQEKAIYGLAYKKY